MTKVLVVGATGGSGRAAVEALLASGWEVTVLVRKPTGLGTLAERVRVVVGDVMRPDDVAAAVRGQDAVVTTLGITENPVRVRLLGSAGTPLDVRSAGTRNVVAAMRAHGVRKLVVQTSYGVGETEPLLPLRYRALFWLLLRPQIADTAVQEALVRDSGLEWILVQPVNLTDAPDDGRILASTRGETGRMSVSRRQVGQFLADALRRPEYVGRSVALSTP